jgi:hypothetical protein
MIDGNQNPLFKIGLTPDLQSQFESLCCLPSETDLPLLKKQITAHIKKIHLALESNEFLNINIAKQAANILIELLDNIGNYSEVNQRLLVGAAKYFVLEEDQEPDTKSPLGLDDDIKVLNHVLGKLGIRKL